MASLRLHIFVLALVIITGTSFAGKVVFLRGTGCAGKTSLCNEFLNQSGWKVVGEDDIYFQEASKRWRVEFPEEFKDVENAIDPENVLHAVMRSQILFRSSASDDQRLKARNAIAKIQTALKRLLIVSRKKMKVSSRIAGAIFCEDELLKKF